MKRTTGTYSVVVAGGEEVRSFTPYPLPPTRPPLLLDEPLQSLLASANAAVGRLAVAGKMVPNAEWFIYGFVRKEAVISSQIEGTQATLRDVGCAEFAPHHWRPSHDVIRERWHTMQPQ